MNILTANLVLSTFVFWVAARSPWRKAPAAPALSSGSSTWSERSICSRLVTHYVAFVVLTERKARWAS